MYSLLYETAMQFGRIWIDQQDNAAAARRVFFSMDHEAEEAATRPAATPPRHADTLSLRFEDVGFRYPDGRRALAEVSFEASAGQTVAIVGPSGAGKTTLAQMIPKFLRPTEGRLTLDGVDLADLDTAALREAVAYVFQEHQLLTDHRGREPAYRQARPPATPRWSRPVGLRAPWTSSGPCPMASRRESGAAAARCRRARKQRLSIARGLLRGAPILILDEPTAALDPQTERALLDALSATGRNRLDHRHRAPLVDHRTRRPHRLPSTGGGSSRPAATRSSSPSPTVPTGGSSRCSPPLVRPRGRFRMRG